jgi:ABC-type sugar transport system substrate-binding protein
MISRFTLLLLLVSLALLPACKKVSTPETTSPKLILLLSANAQHPYEAAQTQMLMRYALNRGEFNLKTFDAAGSMGKQVRQLTEALSLKPYAIIITPIDAGSIAEEVTKAVKDGIVVIGLSESATTLPCSSALLVDQRQLGRLAGEVVVRALTRKAQEEAKSEIVGRIVELRGDDSSPQSAARHEGFMEELGKAPGLVLVHDAPGQWTRQGGKDRTVEAMRLQSRFDALYAHNDSMALGASAALGTQRQEVLIIGTDGGLSLVNGGEIDASIYQPLLVDQAWQIILRRTEDSTFTPKPNYRIAPLAITPKTVDDLRRSGPPPLPAL